MKTIMCGVKEKEKERGSEYELMTLGCSNHSLVYVLICHQKATTISHWGLITTRAKAVFSLGSHAILPLTCIYITPFHIFTVKTSLQMDYYVQMYMKIIAV